MGADMPLDAFEYFNHLDQERFRAVILHATPEKGPSVTRFAQRACEQADGKYLDLLDLFVNDQTLSAKIDRFGPDNFRSLLIELSKGTDLLFVDQADFVLDTWRRRERQRFFRMITNQWDGYREGMATKILISLQTSQEVNSLQILDSQGQSRVLQLSDFNEIL